MVVSGILGGWSFKEYLMSFQEYLVVVSGILGGRLRNTWWSFEEYLVVV